MRTVADHLEAVLSLATASQPTRVSIQPNSHQVLARELTARFAVPPFDNSAMDGYAVRHSDLDDVPATLRVLGDIPAGSFMQTPLEPGTVMRIMTGAPLPPGADTVVPVELTNQKPGDHPLPAQVVINEPVALGRHIRRAGENARVSDVVLNKGTVTSPAAAASAVSVGHSHWWVFPRPRVAVIATGEELRGPGEELAAGQIPDSNSVLLAGLVEQFGGQVIGTYRAADDPQAFGELIAQLPRPDVIVTSGGISAGAFEVVRQAAGAGMEFVQVGMQPGKPQGIGTWDVAGRAVPVLAFPGNPVSVFVSSWLFLRPLLRRLAGQEIADVRGIYAAGTSWNPPVGRAQYLPIVWREGQVVPAHHMGSGSHAIATLHLAQGLAIVPAAIERVAVGDELEVINLRACV